MLTYIDPQLIINKRRWSWEEEELARHQNLEMSVALEGEVIVVTYHLYGGLIVALAIVENCHL